MFRTITFLGLLLVAVLSLNAEIPVTVDPENPSDGGGSGLKAPPMSLTVYIDVERGTIAFSPISTDEVESVSLCGVTDETVIQETKELIISKLKCIFAKVWHLHSVCPVGCRGCHSLSIIYNL